MFASIPGLNSALGFEEEPACAKLCPNLTFMQVVFEIRNHFLLVFIISITLSLKNSAFTVFLLVSVWAGYFHSWYVDYH